MSYTIAFTIGEEPHVIETKCFGFALNNNPLGNLPERETPGEAIQAAIEYGNQLISDGRTRLKNAIPMDDANWGNEVLRLAQQIRAVRRIEALRAASRYWTK